MVREIRVPSSSSSVNGRYMVRKSIYCDGKRREGIVPTVMGLILTPSSTCAMVGSSESLCWRTFLPQRVLTNVVRPADNVN